MPNAIWSARRKKERKAGKAGRQEGRKAGRQEGRKEGRKGGTSRRRALIKSSNPHLTGGDELKPAEFQNRIASHPKPISKKFRPQASFAVDPAEGAGGSLGSEVPNVLRWNAVATVLIFKTSHCCITESP